MIVQLNGYGVIFLKNHADPLGHGLTAQQMDQAVLLGPGCHPLYAETAGGHRAGDGGENLAADLDLAFIILKPHTLIPFLSVPGAGRPSPSMRKLWAKIHFRIVFLRVIR